LGTFGVRLGGERKEKVERGVTRKKLAQPFHLPAMAGRINTALLRLIKEGTLAEGKKRGHANGRLQRGDRMKMEKVEGRFGCLTHLEEFE